MQSFLNPAEVRATLLRLAAWVGVILFASWPDLGALRDALQDSLLNSGAWDSVRRMLDADEPAFIAITAGLLRVSAPGAGSGLSATLAAVLTFALVVRRATFRRPIGSRFPHLAFALRQGRRDTILHYTSEQFWLRIRSR